MSKIAFIFPGQGAQTTGMGQDFYQETETGREMFEKASEILGFSMTDLCFDPAQTDRLNITEYTQPAIFVQSKYVRRQLQWQTVQLRQSMRHSGLQRHNTLIAHSKILSHPQKSHTLYGFFP